MSFDGDEDMQDDVRLPGVPAEEMGKDGLRLIQLSRAL